MVCAEDVEQELLELWSNVEKEKAARQQCSSARTAKQSDPVAGHAGAQVLRAGSVTAASRGSGSTTAYEAVSLRELHAEGTGARAQSECEHRLDPGVDGEHSIEQEPSNALPSRKNGDAGCNISSTAGSRQSSCGAQPLTSNHSKSAPPKQATEHKHRSGIPRRTEQEERFWSDAQSGGPADIPQEGSLQNVIRLVLRFDSSLRKHHFTKKQTL